MKLINVILFLCLVSCQNDKYQGNDKYQIINLLYKKYSRQKMEFFVFPARTPPIPNKKTSQFIDYTRTFRDSIYADSVRNVLADKITKKDSLKRIKFYLSKKENQQIFAFDPKMKKYHNLTSIKLIKNIDGFKKLYDKFIISNNVDSIEILKISKNLNDSIISFREDFEKDSYSEFKQFNVLLSFSEIIFSDNCSKAIVIGTIGHSKTDFNSKIYFLKKVNKKWNIKYEVPI